MHASLMSDIKTTSVLVWKSRLGRALVGFLGAVAVIYLFEIASEEFRASVTSNLDRLVLPLMIGLFIGRTRGDMGLEERRFWRLMIAAMSIWLAGTALYYVEIVAGLPRWVDLAVDCCYILLYLAMFVASDQQPQLADGWSRRDPVYPFTMVAATIFIAIMFAYFIVVPWVFQPSENAQYASSFNLYVTLDVILTLRFLLLRRASSDPRWRRCFALLATATGALAIGDLLEGLYFAEIFVVVIGARLDVIWLIPYLCLGAVALTCTNSVADDLEIDGGARVESLIAIYAFALPLIHLGLSLLKHLDPSAHAAREAIVFSGLVVFAALTVVQQISLERAVTSLRSDLSVRALDDKLRRSQRLEAIGRLAGGIAHDFNNLLMVIRSYAELAATTVPPELRGIREKLKEIDRASDRAADLVRQLLAFGRRQMLRPEVVHVNDMVAGLEGMLSRIIGDDVELTVDLDPAAGYTRVDPALLEQVIVNLVVNAKDAMPRGGDLGIRTRSVAGQPDGGEDVGDGSRSVELIVTDSGMGIDPEIRDLIFEPYFTTKEMEKGTGLGLATVYGIVEQSGGTIEVESSPDRGSAFIVRLQQVPESPSEPVEPQPHSSRSVAGETVLLTEDETTIREALAEYLEGLGIEVIQAEDGVDALERAQTHAGRIDVLVTDLVMPRMSGPELAARLVEVRRGLKVIYVSGYTPEAMREYGVNRNDAVFLQKPFLLGDLGATIRDMLDSR